MPHVISVTLVILLALPLTSRAVSKWPRAERKVVWASFAAHSISSFVLLWVMTDVYGGVSDLLTYLSAGEALAAYVSDAPWQRAPTLLMLIAQQEVRLPVPIIGIGSSTGSMAGVAGALLLVVRSGWAANLVVSLLAFSGQLGLYAFFRPELRDPQERVAVAASTLLLPSLAFWTSGLVKEAFALAGLGYLFSALRGLSRRGPRPQALLVASLGVVLIGLSKPYLFLPLTLAVSVWAAWQHSVNVRSFASKTSAWRLIPLGLVAYLCVVIVGRFLPEYSVDSLGETIAMQQYYGARVGGGSYIEVGDAAARSLTSQLVFAPAALFTVLFRPLVFEVSNMTMAVNAIETTTITMIAAYSIVQLGPRRAWSHMRSRPLLMMALVFVVVGGTGVGLATTNLGTLSRYRVPLMPFYLLLLTTSAVTARSQKLAARSGRDSARITPAPTPTRARRQHHV